MDKGKLDRINYLAKKAKTEALTDAEKEEQKKLRKEYLEGFRSSFKNQITNLTVIDPEGKDVTPEKVKRIKKNKHKH